VIERQIAEIANYLWMKSIGNISRLLPDGGPGRLNVKDYYYLTVIAGMDNPRFSDISQTLKLTPPAITALVRRLELAGLLVKERSGADGRVYHIALTDRGRRIIEGDTMLYERFGGIVRETVTKDKLRELEALLAVVIQELHREDGV